MRAVSVTVALLVLLLASPALAQQTGGSFGGGGFNRRSSSSSTGSRSAGSGSSWGSGSRSRSGSAWGGSSSRSRSSRAGSTSTSRTYDDSRPSGGGYASSTGSGGGTSPLGGGLCCLLAFVGVLGFFFVVNRKKSAAATAALGGGAPSTYAGPNAMYVGRLSVGVDWRARRDLQATLTRLAQSGDTSSPQGLANLLREVVLALRRAELSWLYASHEIAGPLSQRSAEQRFNQLTVGARASFQHELVRNASTTAAPAMQANASEGEGTVVVHLIIAAYRPLAAVTSPDAGSIRMALDNRAALTADQLGALEVVWSPAAEDDRMSTAELEQLYPDMRLIDPNSIAGRIFCSYCRGPFAMELLTCPHCGAPAETSRENRSPR